MRVLCQGPVIESGICSDLRPVERLIPLFGHKGGNTHYQSTSLVVNRHLLHHLPSMSTTIHVSRRWTNLVIIDSLLQIFEKPGDFLVVLNMIGKADKRRLLFQRPQCFSDVLECTRGL